MDKLKIIGRTNWETGFYAKFRAEKISMKQIKKIVGDLGSEYFVDRFCQPKTFSNYDKWKDEWIPIYSKNITGSIICGDKVIHMIVTKCENLDLINNILNKHCKWANIKRKK